MKTLIATLLLAGTLHATTQATAYFTGRMKYVTTVTYERGVQCEYRYLNHLFWRTFSGSSCPSSIEVR